jgi:hypothetical protein
MVRKEEDHDPSSEFLVRHPTILPSIELYKREISTTKEILNIHLRGAQAKKLSTFSK